MAPSVQSFVSLRGDLRPSRAGKALVGFGDFLPERDLDGSLQVMHLPETCRPEIRGLAALPPLPGSAGELRAVQAAFGASASDIYVGRDFTEARVRSTRLADYRVVYFATHALLPHDFNCWSEPLLLASGPARRPHCRRQGRRGADGQRDHGSRARCRSRRPVGLQHRRPGRAIGRR